jgi:hypothetical protein
MKLRNPPATYSPAAEITRNQQIERANDENHKRGRDIEVAPARLILTSPNGTRFSLAVTDAGAITLTAI